MYGGIDIAEHNAFVEVFCNLRLDFIVGDRCLERNEILAGVYDLNAEERFHFLIRNEEVAHSVEAAADGSDLGAWQSTCRACSLYITDNAIHNVGGRVVTCRDRIGLSGTHEQIGHVHYTVYAVAKIDLRAVLRGTEIVCFRRIHYDYRKIGLGENFCGFKGRRISRMPRYDAVDVYAFKPGDGIPELGFDTAER